MSYVYINLFNKGVHAEVNPDEAIVRLQEQFPEAVVLPGDQLARSARRAEQLDQTNPANQTVVKKRWWDARNAGPAYAFYSPSGTGPRIEGVTKRYQAAVHSDAAFPEAARSRIVPFLRPLRPEAAA